MIDPGTRGVMQVAREVLSELDLDEVLGRVLSSAQALTGARYAALGVLDESGERLADFLTVGMDERGVLSSVQACPPERIDSSGGRRPDLFLGSVTAVTERWRTKPYSVAQFAVTIWGRARA